MHTSDLGPSPRCRSKLQLATTSWGSTMLAAESIAVRQSQCPDGGFIHCADSHNGELDIYRRGCDAIISHDNGLT